MNDYLKCFCAMALSKNPNICDCLTSVSKDEVARDMFESNFGGVSNNCRSLSKAQERTRPRCDIGCGLVSRSRFKSRNASFSSSSTHSIPGKRALSLSLHESTGHSGNKIVELRLCVSEQLERRACEAGPRMDRNVLCFIEFDKMRSNSIC